jgi:hypothetical protein
MFAYYSPFQIRQRVTIDNDNSLVGAVTGVLSRECFCYIEVSYIHNGDAKVALFDPWRLKLVNS